MLIYKIPPNKILSEGLHRDILMLSNHSLWVDQLAVENVSVSVAHLAAIQVLGRSVGK